MRRATPTRRNDEASLIGSRRVESGRLPVEATGRWQRGGLRSQYAACRTRGVASVRVHGTLRLLRRRRYARPWAAAERGQDKGQDGHDDQRGCSGGQRTDPLCPGSSAQASDAHSDRTVSERSDHSAATYGASPEFRYARAVDDGRLRSDGGGESSRALPGPGRVRRPLNRSLPDR